MQSFVCASHGHCFDGLASAALLTDLVRQTRPKTAFTYRALGYGAQPTRVVFSGAQNALLDYKYLVDPALTYYIDHHPTAFTDDEALRHFEQRRTADPLRFVHDASSVSCANLVAQLARSEYGYDTAQNRELEAFAEKIDGARFESVHEAIDLESPLMRLVSTVTHFGDDAFYRRAISVLQAEGLHALADQKWVQAKFTKLAPAIEALNQRIKRNGTLKGRVALIQLLDSPSHVISKFRQYYEFPSAVYSVLLLRTHEMIRISVGYNPWCGQPCDVNIGQICQKYGGGGHAVVGAIGLNEDKAADAIEIATTITHALQTPEMLP